MRNYPKTQSCPKCKAQMKRVRSNGNGAQYQCRCGGVGFILSDKGTAYLREMKRHKVVTPV